MILGCSAPPHNLNPGPVLLGTTAGALALLTLVQYRLMVGLIIMPPQAPSGSSNTAMATARRQSIRSELLTGQHPDLLGWVI